MQGLILICMKMCGNSAVEGHELASWSCCYIDLDHFSHGLWQATFACEVLEAPHLRKAYTWHTTSTVIGGALFVADDIYPNTPYIHAARHVPATVGVAT
jgi:hypothetical protein